MQDHRQKMEMHEPYRIETKKVMLDNLDQLWRPFLLLSRAIGAFPFTTVKRNGVIQWYRNWWNLYSIFYLGLASFALVSLIVLVTIGGVSKIDDGVRYVSYCAFLLHIVLSTVTFIYLLNFKTYLCDMCELWSSLEFGRGTADKLIADVKRKVKYNFVLTILGCILYLFAFAVILIDHGAYISFQEVFIAFFIFWCSVSNAVELGFFCTMCRTSSYLLKSICCDLEDKLTEENIEIHLKWFRDAFMAVIDFVEVSNKLFGKYVGFLVTFFLVETCCNTYLFFPYTDYHNILVMASDLIFVVEGLVIIIIVCLSAGEIAEQAGRSFRLLLKINVTESPSNRQIQELMLLLDCSKTLEAKISMFGIISITKETLPMIFGIYLSYVFLLYQFPHDSKTTGDTDTQNLDNSTISF